MKERSGTFEARDVEPRRGADRKEEPTIEVAPGLEAEAAREAKEKEPVRRTYEYRDTEGKVLGRAELELADEIVEIDERMNGDVRVKGKARKVLRFVIKGTSPAGEATEIDVMALANPHGTELLMGEERLDNYFYSNAKKRAVVPPLETPLDVGVALHELGHADQFHDPRFGEVTPLYGAERNPDPKKKMTYERIRDLFERIVDAVPEASHALEVATIDQLDRLQERKLEETRKWRSLETSVREQHDIRAYEFAAFLKEAVAAKLDVDAYVAECEEAEKEMEDKPLDSWALRAKMADLVSRLEKAGLRFAASSEASNAEGPIFVGPVGKGDFAYSRLSRTMITIPEEAGRLAKALFVDGNVDLKRVKTTYDNGTGAMTMTLPLDGAKEFSGFGATLTVEMTEDEFDRFVDQKLKKDAIIADLERMAAAHRQGAADAETGIQYVLDDIDVAGILSIPTRMLERDATRRALQWLRKVRQRTNVDLFAPHKAPRQALIVKREAVPACTTATSDGMSGKDDRTVEAGVLEDLKAALATYKADKFRVRGPDEVEGGVTPMPGTSRGLE